MDAERDSRTDTARTRERRHCAAGAAKASRATRSGRPARLATCASAWRSKAAARETAAARRDADPRRSDWEARWKRIHGERYAELATSLERLLSGEAGAEDRARLERQAASWRERAAHAGSIAAGRAVTPGSNIRNLRRKARQAGHLALLAEDLESSLRGR